MATGSHRRKLNNQRFKLSNHNHNHNHNHNLNLKPSPMASRIKPPNYRKISVILSITLTITVVL
ncbi:MAG: hypothetical protein N6V41_00845, partial [Candidatus Portiera aleyrodidarum]|nr:hypothetical protein [Candidatus Portiera aleyrodidarum]